MYYASDNAGPVHPHVMQALMDANTDYVPSYGGDTQTAAAVARIRDLFEAPEAVVQFVTTGTAANVLLLATMAQPWQTVFCGENAHIHEDECGSPEFFGGGIKLTTVAAPAGKIDPDALAAAMAPFHNASVHSVQAGPLSITQSTERGTVYTLDELRRLSQIAHDHDQLVHLDGARFANALVELGCSPADMTWRAGIDAVSLGGTKNGLMGVEAMVIFDPALGRELELRRKRGAHLASKHRFLAAQMNAYLRDDLWLDMAGKSNAAARTLADGLRATGKVNILYPVDANTIFASWPRALHQKLHDAGAVYYVWGGSLKGDDPDELLTARLVCDWSTQPDLTARFLDLFADA